MGPNEARLTSPTLHAESFGPFKQRVRFAQSISADVMRAALSRLVLAQANVRVSRKMAAKLPSAAQVQKSAIVIDTHADTPQRLVDEGFDLADPLNGGNLNLVSVRKGGLSAEFFSIWVEPAIYQGQYAGARLS